MSWTVIYIGHNHKNTEIAKDALSKEGFLVRVQKNGEAKVSTYELSVMNEEAADAHEVLSELIYF